MSVMSDHDDKPETVHDVLAAEEFGMGSADPALHEESPHDVLAAEEFGMGTADPALHAVFPHDVLAADEFEVGAGDPALSRAPIEVPESPSVGAGPAREVLAADAFAVPAGRTVPELERAARNRRRLPALAAAAGLLAWIVRRRR
ncbi:MAG TPA: hypothetical protein VGL69_02360 [Solirubrobacteraceae bacterium]|jgi:hypothetical protein